MTTSHECTEELFLRDVALHQMTVIRDDGANRHIRFKKPDSSDMYFDLITWPGSLCYTGDMGTFVFQRLEDMFQFFRTDRDHGQPEKGKTLFINTGYWGEKCVAVDSVGGIRKYSPDLFREVIQEWQAEQEDLNEKEKAALAITVEGDLLDYADEGEEMVRSQVDGFGFICDDGSRLTITDFWEHTLTAKTFRFVWCCYALAWGIKVYDEKTDGNHPEGKEHQESPL